MEYKAKAMKEDLIPYYKWVYGKFVFVGYIKKQIMIYKVISGNECYIYMNGKLIHKTRTDNSESGVTFDVMAYRKNDSLKSIRNG